MAESITTYELFKGKIRSLNVTLGINQNPTVVTTTVVEDGDRISIANREFVRLSIGAFDFGGVVQSYSRAKVDIAGTGIYQVRITDTKPVLNAAQVIIGSSFDETETRAYNYGDNVIPIVPANASQISNGIPFSTIQSTIESARIRYGKNVYRINFNFTLPSRGSLVEYTLKGRALSLSELISQIANDHGLDWYVTTSTSKVISVNMFGRTNITNMTVNQLASLHPNAIIRRHEGKENRDAIQKVVLLGGYKSYLHRTDGVLWKPFWGLDANGDKRSEPVYSTEVMETIVNSDFTSEDYTEEDAQKILSYANEFWGRKFIAKITPSETIGSDGKSWVVPTSAGWNNSDSTPMNFNVNGRLKFQTEDGRWVTFATLPLPGTRPLDVIRLTYQWDDGLFSNPNSHIDDNGDISMKASLEIMGQYFLLTLATPLRVKLLTPTTVVDPETGLSETLNNITKTRLTILGDAYLALLDQRETYGPWSNRDRAIGRTEVIIDSSLTPWLFGYRGITNSTGLNLLKQVALAKIKTVADTTLDAQTAELEVAGVPAINIGDQLQTTGAITSIQIIFAINGIRTIYKALQYTTELSKYVRQQQDLLDRLRRQAAEFNNTMNPPKDDWELDKTIRTLKKELPEPPVDVPTEGNRRQLKTLLGRIASRSSTTQPKYNITPMAWISDAFGSLSLVRDPSIFGEYLNVVNMGEKQTTGGRLSIGTDVQVHEFAITDGGIVSYYIDVAVAKTPNFTATIAASVSNSQPIYQVTPVVSAVQQINLTSRESLALNAVLNIGEPANFKGYLAVGTEVMIYWNENGDGSFTPFMEQQVNLFKPL